MPRKIFRELTETSPAFARHLLRTVHSRQRLLVDHIERVTVHDAGGRVINYLLSLTREQSGKERITLPIAKRDLAAHLAIQPETLSRVFAKMKSRSILEQAGGDLIVDIGELREHRSCTTCTLNCWGCPRYDEVSGQRDSGVRLDRPVSLERARQHLG